MPIVTAPSLDDLRAIVEFAQAGSEADPNDVFVQTLAWLDALENLDDASKIRLAVDSAEGVLPNFEGMIAMSTAHVSAETAKRLGDGEIPVVCYPHGENGWQIHVSVDEDVWGHHEANHATNDLPDDLFALMKYVRDTGCCWLLLDADASEIDGLQTFEW